MDKKKCIITGSNGYLGKQLSVIFKKYGWQVVELSSSNKDDQFNFTNLDSFTENKNLIMEVKHSDGAKELIICNHTYNNTQIEWFKAGSALNLIRKNN